MADWLDWLKTAGKVAGSAAKYYIDYKDQERKSEVSEQAYRQYAQEIADAKAEAQAAIDINLTPMEILNVPTTKADVSDFTAVAARGGLMNLPTKQRKRYAFGPNPEDLPNQGSPSIMADAITDSEVEDAYGVSVEDAAILAEIRQIAAQSASPQDFPATDSDYMQLEILSDKHKVDLEVIIQMAKETNFATPEQSKGEMYAQYMAQGGRIGYQEGTHPLDGIAMEMFGMTFENLNPLQQIVVSQSQHQAGGSNFSLDEYPEKPFNNPPYQPVTAAQGGRIKKDNGGIMNLGGMEKDYRTTGGFVPLGGRERADDVPARLSKNEFVMTADAVRAAGGGSINKGAQRMYNTMKHLEASPGSKRMTA